MCSLLIIKLCLELHCIVTHTVYGILVPLRFISGFSRIPHSLCCRSKFAKLREYPALVYTGETALNRRQKTITRK